MDIIFFFYTLSFFGLGFSLLACPRDKDTGIELAEFVSYLTAFAFLHGALEAVDLYRVVRGVDAIPQLVHTLLLWSSFWCLFEFARRLLRASLPGKNPRSFFRGLFLGPWSRVWAGLIPVAGVFLFADSLQGIETLTRITLGLPGALFAGVGFYMYSENRVKQTFKSTDTKSIHFAAIGAAIGFITYSVFAGVVIAPIPGLPSFWPTQEAFFATFHFPVQLLRTVCAAVIAISVGIVLRIFWLEARARLDDALSDLRFALDAAENANSAKSRFLAVMSHEIRTPINGVIGMSQLLCNTELSSRQKEYVDAVSISAESLLTLVNDILDLSKIEAGKMGLEVLNFDLHQLIADVTKAISFIAAKKGLELRTEFVPPMTPEMIKQITGDPNRIRQVLFNLLSNAIKFTERGEVRLRISGEWCASGQIKVRIEVRDTGVGIPEAAQGTLFSAFSQADSTTSRKYGGTGLGLAICKQIITLMGGEIGLFSKQGEGTTVWFVLTLPVVELALPEQPETASEPTGFKLNPGEWKVLVVEDNLINQAVVLGQLDLLGCTASVADNGARAIDALTAPGASYHLVLMDCHMPEMDGFEATKRIRRLPSQRTAQIPIVAMTADALVGDREKCLAAGMNDCLPKPFKVVDLVALLNQYLR